jgi:murein DD-endopeptidase MepM/ murein hydrolase activator NlpD
MGYPATGEIQGSRQPVRHDALTARKSFLFGLAAISVVAWAVVAWSGDASAKLRQSAVLVPPVADACISSPFGPRVLVNEPQAGTYHYGVDLPAPQGAPVLATAPGTVIRIQNKGPGGLEMLVQHDGFLGIYSHFGMIDPAFAAGKRTVAAGEKLGVVGNTGITFGPHLYFQMDLDGKPVDPAPYLGVRPCSGEVRQAAARAPLDIDERTGIDPKTGIDERIVGSLKIYMLPPVAQPYQLPQH